MHKYSTTIISTEAVLLRQRRQSEFALPPNPASAVFNPAELAPVPHDVAEAREGAKAVSQRAESKLPQRGQSFFRKTF